jgi:hypothetical protein
MPHENAVHLHFRLTRGEASTCGELLLTAKITVFSVCWMHECGMSLLFVYTYCYVFRIAPTGGVCSVRCLFPPLLRIVQDVPVDLKLVFETQG